MIDTEQSTTPSPRGRRITLVIHALRGGGAERQLTQLANRWTERGERVTVVTLSAPEPGEYPLSATIERRGLGLQQSGGWRISAPLRTWQRLRRLRQELLASRPQAVVSFTDRMNILTLTALIGRRVPVIIAERSDPRRQQLGWWWESWRRWSYRRASACVAQRPDVADYLRRLAPSAQMAVIGSAIEPTTPAAPATGVRDGPKRLITVGRLSPEKGIDRLLAAWAHAAARLPDWQLVVVGDGTLSEPLKQLCTELGIDSRVAWRGWLSDPRRELQAASAFVMTSHYEGFPQALLEAMDCGLPALVPAWSADVAQWLGDEQAGWLIADPSPHQLGNQLVRFLENPQRLAEQGRVARALAAGHHWDRIEPQWTAVLDRLLLAAGG
jgi:GalNAc-alpha-(1->4)-GalNAc-alpha-(1->3)-diNAcBac-PP-undecaprenol alpha-1,4-N-acetyl-D-galactosaminyltransferase